MSIFGSNNSTKPAYLIVGLGNPGSQYARTRHNIGFCALDYLSGRMGIKINKLKHFALVGRGEIAGKSVLLMQPQTYMNESGRAVADAARFYGIKPENVIVIFDDVSLPVGKHRFRKNGSAGGHNGIKSLIEHLGTQDFPRLKIGVGEKPYPEMDLAAHVLGNIPAEEYNIMSRDFDLIPDTLAYIMSGDFDKAANTYNK